MESYNIIFRTDCGSATEEIEAASSADALTAARKIASDDEERLYFQPYDDALPINEIAIEDEAGQELSVWRDEDLSLRLAANDLLNAGRLVVARWEHGDLAGAVRTLASAIAKAEG